MKDYVVRIKDCIVCGKKTLSGSCKYCTECSIIVNRNKNVTSKKKKAEFAKACKNEQQGNLQETD